MKRFLFLLILIISISAVAQAQSLDENRLELNLWHSGKVSLRNGEVIEGKINFNYIVNMIRVQSGGMLNTFNHKQILEFEVFKEEENRTVYYKSLNLPIGDKIYEVVGEDDEKALLVTTIIDKESETEYSNLGLYGPRYRYNALPPTPGNTDLHSKSKGRIFLSHPKHRQD